MTNQTINTRGVRGAGGNSSHAQVTRKDFTDRLGLPADATDEQVLAGVDAVAARERAQAASAGAAGTSREPGSELYEAAWGGTDARPAAAQASASLAVDELYEAAWPEDSAIVTHEDTYPTGGER